MKLFFQYLKGRRGILCLLALFSAIHFVTSALFRLPIAAGLYPMALCLLAGLAALFFDFQRTRRLHRQLDVIRSPLDAAAQPLPEAAELISADYSRIISLLVQEQRESSARLARRYQDIVDYYTIWVHQIKTPISSMHLQLQSEDTDLARRLKSDLTRIEQYVEMVLVYLRLDADTTDYVIREQELDPIIRSALRKFAGEFIARRLTLQYEPVGVSVITDEKWLSFVVEQVLSNALKYTPSGSIRICLESPKTLCVSDTGYGIAPEDLPRIFEKGYTGCRGRSDKKASGIGLYLCRRICKNLGHQITAESVPGRGTTIRIRLDQRPLEVE